MSAPQSLSVIEIRKFMIDNGCKVTNHALVKHFKRFLTHPETQSEARKEFKTYVNILATVKNENNQKYLILRKKYLNECPTEDAVQRAVAAAALSPVPNSPGGISIISDSVIASPLRQPPPYIPPPEVGTTPTTSKSQNMLPTNASGVGIEQEHAENYRECVSEFETAVLKIDAARKLKSDKVEQEPVVECINENVVETRAKSISRQASTEDPQSNKENIPRFSFSSSASGTSVDSANVDKVSGSDVDAGDNPISVKEATRKFNRMASEEEAKLLSPSSKKKPDKDFIEEKHEPEVTVTHPKAKEWIVAMAKASYQDLAKLAKEYPELVKLSVSLRSHIPTKKI
ncbi:uncharacterized protein LOC119673264 [Teleopsis dalmanni]|uniref:uncharacterized protein LOC119673264 n=1 Tax=Teleopsis dalmanni TaxID=139649 RepID=UPI0018CF2CFB|nr:uncharacterized protein LOC119673264 [Teleopsis dalmanni]